MLLSPQGNKSDRPGLFQSSRGQQIKVGMVLLVAVGAVLWFLTAILSPADEPTAAAGAQEPALGAPAAVNEPSWETAARDPFAMSGQVAQLPNGFEGSDAHSSMINAALTTAAQASTYSSGQTPEQYVDGIETLSDDARGTVLESVQGSWDEVAEARVSVTGVASGGDPVVRAYDEETMQATVEASADLTITNADGQKTTSARAFLVHMVGSEAEDGTVTWEVTGYESL